ncbi:alpha-hydroxy acid oxidase [Nocardioides sp. LML1-1-1.1]|uniref:alpha-hydroxy acid oxidase n=1 Tax=Nocardioides sp. LML1-1-1.1 TaxID=3135248 RepID=UPI00343E5CB4
MTHAFRSDHADAEPAPDGADFATLGEIYATARERLLPEVWEVLDGGAGEEQSLRDNIAAMARWCFRPRYLGGLQASDVSTRFLGIDLALPVLTAPIGGDGMFHERGQCAIAEATAAAGTVTIVSEASPFVLETVAAASRAPKIMQLMAWGEPEQFLALARRAVAAGYAALCVTIDCPTLGWRERPMKSRFTTPGRQWSGNYPQAADRLAAGVGSTWTWETFAQVRAELDLPVLAKGVMTAEDAVAAVESGASGVVVSNHGGRQLDCLPATLDQLPEVADAVGDRVPVAFDGGIRRGADVLKALALGADVVCVGRLTAMSLAAGGTPAVLRALDLLRAELERSMLLVGRASIADVDRTVVQPRLSGGAPGERE